MKNSRTLWNLTTDEELEDPTEHDKEMHGSPEKVSPGNHL
jgi:hypothetical protein